jgi:hypothetical protein
MKKFIENIVIKKSYRNNSKTAGTVIFNRNNRPRILSSILGETPNKWADEERDAGVRA